MAKVKGSLDIIRQIFLDWKEGKTNKNGIAIPDCRNKEVMIVGRFGGDIIIAFFDDIVSKELELINPKFYFVMEMMQNSNYYWNEIFRRFIEIKAKLK